MRPKEIHCVCPFLRAKPMGTGEFLELSAKGNSADSGLNFEGIYTAQILYFMMQICSTRMYEVEERSVNGGKIL